jgi:hypothetical protein
VVLLNNTRGGGGRFIWAFWFLACWSRGCGLWALGSSSNSVRYPQIPRLPQTPDQRPGTQGSDRIRGHVRVHFICYLQFAALYALCSSSTYQSSVLPYMPYAKSTTTTRCRLQVVSDSHNGLATLAREFFAALRPPNARTPSVRGELPPR